MQDALITSVQSMHSDMERLATISRNMANVATPGYKREIAATRPFSDLLRAEGDGAGVDLSPGPLRASAAPFDAAIEGDGYFEVMTAHGPAYTRAGSFHLDPQGRLVNDAGLAVQGSAGDIVLRGPQAELDRQGRILQEGRAVAQLKVVRFAPGQALRRGPEGLLRPAGADAGAALAAPMLRPGFVEGSNVAPLREVLAMTETARHFESAQRLYQGYEEQMSGAIRTLGEF